MGISVAVVRSRYRNLLRAGALLSAVLCCVVAKPSAAAEQFSLLINGKAIHFDQPEGKKRYNEENWGAGFEYEFASRGQWVPFITASGFIDSNSNPSYYAGGGASKRYEFGDGYHVDLGGVAFLMTRKGFHGGDPFLGALPVFSVGGERYALNMTFVPKIEPKAVPLVFFQLKVTFTGSH